MLNSADKISEWIFRCTLILEPVKATNLINMRASRKHLCTFIKCFAAYDYKTLNNFRK